jgi:hypothetical protein
MKILLYILQLVPVIGLIIVIWIVYTKYEKYSVYNGIGIRELLFSVYQLSCFYLILIFAAGII